MTPCEKLGYKVGDKFEMLRSSCGFKKGQTVTLFRDDRTDAPCFKGDNTAYNHAGGEPGAYINLSNVKPVSQRVTKPISKSKRQLAQLLIEAGVTQFPKGANWAAQDKCDLGCAFSSETPTHTGGSTMHHCNASRVWQVDLPVLIPNWHQTVLSRDEFDQIVAETVVPDEPEPEPTAAPTLDQLLQDWRNADDYAQRKQTEADQAAAMRDERWQAVQTRAGEMGVTVGRCEPVAAPDELELVVTDWRDLREDDVIVLTAGRRYNNTECVMTVIDGYGLRAKSSTDTSTQWYRLDDESEWRFVRRP